MQYTKKNWEFWIPYNLLHGGIVVKNQLIINHGSTMAQQPPVASGNWSVSACGGKPSLISESSRQPWAIFDSKLFWLAEAKKISTNFGFCKALHIRHNIKSYKINLHPKPPRVSTRNPSDYTTAIDHRAWCLSADSCTFCLAGDWSCAMFLKSPWLWTVNTKII